MTLPNEETFESDPQLEVGRNDPSGRAWSAASRRFASVATEKRARSRPPHLRAGRPPLEA